MPSKKKGMKMKLVHWGNNCSFIVIKKKDKKQSDHLLFEGAKAEAESLAKQEREEYCIYKLVARIIPKPVETVTKILNDAQG